MTRPPLVRLVIDTATRFQSNRCALMAAGLAYYLLISISPVFVVAIGVAGFFLGREEVEHALLGRVTELLGQPAADTVQRLVDDPTLFSGGVTASVIAVIVLLYGSTRAFAALQSAFDVIWETPPSPNIRLSAMHFIRSRLVAVVLVLATSAVILAAMALETVGSSVSAVLSSSIPGLFPITAAGRITTIGLRLACLVGLYRWLPRDGSSWRAAWPAALLATALLSLGHALIGMYIKVGGVQSAYGAAGSVIALLFAFYYAAYIVLLGAQVTRGVAVPDPESSPGSE